MINETVLRAEGFKALTERFGIFESERFIAIIKREPFNYTEWREDLYKDTPLDIFLNDADNFRKTVTR
ncbi:hypothetical protein FACS1894130_07980 [Spirochaetia bacterium]|nr:hypothetical protein FACS1894130_07980 [Spirochaetia bacterium]